MEKKVQLFLLFEAIAFALASLIHSGVFISGFEHNEARIAEGVIAAVLIIAWILALVRREWTRLLGLAAQGFALLGTLVGLLTIAIGIGPRTIPDLVYHIGIVIVLIWGLWVAYRLGTREAGTRS